MNFKYFIISKSKFLIELLTSTQLFYKILLLTIILIPKIKVINKERFPKFLRLFGHLVTVIRKNINLKSTKTRSEIAHSFLIPSINILFDKNYVNFAQTLLFSIEEFLLSFNNEKDFEKALELFMYHAISAGERFREQYPLPHKKALFSEQVKNIGFIGHSVAQSGFEVLLGFGPYLKEFKVKYYTMRVFENNTPPKVNTLFDFNSIELFITKPQKYDVFKLRELFLENPSDILIWSPLPPFHMFFIFSFGLHQRQFWLSQYLRPNIKFKYLENIFTLGGAGTLSKKIFNNKEWNIVPQVGFIPGISKKPCYKYLFVPARLEKLKQPDFLDCITEILKKDKSTHLKWTGYYPDKEIIKYFDEKNLSHRHTFIPWLNEKDLVQEIKSSSLILACFPLSLGTVEYFAAQYKIPIISMYDEEKNLYWRDIYWEAINGNEELRHICLDQHGESKIPIILTSEEYVNHAIKLLNDENFREIYKEVYFKSYTYTYLNNQNNISKLFKEVFDKEFKTLEVSNEMA